MSSVTRFNKPSLANTVTHILPKKTQKGVFIRVLTEKVKYIPLKCLKHENFRLLSFHVVNIPMCDRSKLLEKNG